MTDKPLVSPCGDHEYPRLPPFVDVLFIVERKPESKMEGVIARIAVNNGHRTHAVMWVDTRRSKRQAGKRSTPTGDARLRSAVLAARNVVWCCDHPFMPLRDAQVLGLDKLRAPVAPTEGARIKPW